MNLIIKTAVGAALLGATSMAFATSVTPPASGPTPQPTSGPGGLIVEVYDTVSGVSLAEWLGPTLATLGNTTAQTAGTTDYGVLGGTATVAGGTTDLFSSLFSSSEIAAGNVVYTINAATSAISGQNAFATTLSSVGTSITNSKVNATAVSLGSGVSAILNGVAACNGLNPCTATSATAATSAQLYFNSTYSGLPSPFNAGGTVGGSAVGFYLIAQTSTSTLKQASVTQFAGAGGAATWALSASGDLVYTVPGQVSAVPLPAAVWLLGSGLLGLAGVGRRKMAA